MATYNGADHVAEQIQSFQRQTHGDWSLTVGDDGSQDDTLVRIEQTMAGSDHPLRITKANGGNGARNFLTLLTTAPCGDDEFVALSDQDDVWLEDKLSRAIEQLAEVPANIPTLYCSRTLLTDAALRPSGPSRLHSKFSFRNATVQNVVAGNTTVLNKAAMDLVRAAGVVDVKYHDWWLYLLITGAGGRVLYDPAPSLYYRQHGENELGENRSLQARLKRAMMVNDGRWAVWVDKNLQALTSVSPLLTPDTQDMLARLAPLSGASRKERRRWLATLKPYRQSRIETAALYGSILAGRI